MEINEQTLPSTLIELYRESEIALNEGVEEKFIAIYNKMFTMGFELYKQNGLTVKNYDNTDRPDTLSENDIFFPFYAGVRLAAYYAEKDLDKAIEIRNELMGYVEDACKTQANILKNHIFLKFLYYSSPYSGDEEVELKGSGSASKMMWMLYFAQYEAMADYYLVKGDSERSYANRYEQIVQGCKIANESVRYILFLPSQMIKLLLLCRDEEAVKTTTLPLMRLFYQKKNPKYMNSNITEAGQLIDSFLEMKNYKGMSEGVEAMIESLKAEAADGNGFANCALGLLSEKGIILPKDDDQAINYYMAVEETMEYAANKIELSDDVDEETRLRAEDLRTALRIEGEVKYANNQNYFEKKFGEQ